MGGDPLENKIYWYQDSPRRDQGNITKSILAWGGVPLENKIYWHQGRPRRDQGIITKSILACGGSLWKIKIIGTKADPVVTNDFSPNQFSRGGGSL